MTVSVWPGDGFRGKYAPYTERDATVLGEAGRWCCNSGYPQPTPDEARVASLNRTIAAAVVELSGNRY